MKLSKLRLSPATAIALVALFVALGGVGVAANGQGLILGQSNSASSSTSLSAPVAGGKALQLTNNDATNASSTALGLTVASGHAPFTVSSKQKVANLNSDWLDGLDSSSFLLKTGTAANAAKLGGQLPSYYLPATGKAADSENLDGIDSSGFWNLGGNAAASTGVLGTTTDQALELKVSGQRALRLEPNSNGPNLIGGFSGNSVTAGLFGATVAGGGGPSNPNSVTDIFGTVGGGDKNTAGNSGTVSGGSGNTASSGFDTVAGGVDNTASGGESTVAGGSENTASGYESFAAGNKAVANKNGSFVWSDGNWSGGKVYSPGSYSFSAHATGGFNFWTNKYAPTTGCFIDAGGGSIYCSSSRLVKRNFAEVNRSAVLRRLARIPITTWSYKAERNGIRHIGPMAQDFHAAFGVGKNDTSIAMVDADGVALAAIQGLYRQNQILKEQNRTLNTRLTRLERMVATLSH